MGKLKSVQEQKKTDETVQPKGEKAIFAESIKKRKWGRLEFSKLIIIPETILTWYATFKSFSIIEMAVRLNYTGSLPYFTTLLTAIWAAYGISVGFYYNKAKCENVLKISAATRQDTDN